MANVECVFAQLNPPTKTETLMRFLGGIVGVKARRSINKRGPIPEFAQKPPTCLLETTAADAGEKNTVIGGGGYCFGCHFDISLTCDGRQPTPPSSSQDYFPAAKLP